MSEITAPALTCEEIQASLSAYALGILDSDERIDIDAHLSTCESCRSALIREMSTVDALAWAVTPLAPPAALRARLMAELEHEPELVRSAPVISLAERRQRKQWLSRALSTAAAVLLVGIGVLGFLLNRTMDQRDDALADSKVIEPYVGYETVKLEAMHSNTYATYPGHGSLYMAPGQNPLVYLAGCPETGKHVTYWVWVAHNGARTPMGQLTIGDDGSGTLTLPSDDVLAEYDQIGITIEWKNSEETEDVLVGPL